MADEQDREEVEPEGIESWLTAPEVTSTYGVPASTLTRAAQEGNIKRMRVKRPGDTRATFVYEPASLDEARANGQLGPVLNTAGEGMLLSGAAMMAKTNELAIAMAGKLIQGIDAVTRAQEKLTTSNTAMSEAFLHQFERLDARNAANEQVVLDYIRARQQIADEQAENELELNKFQHSANLKEMGLKKLLDHLEPLIELAAMYAKSKREEPESAKTDDSKAEKVNPESTATDGTTVIDTTGESVKP